MIRATGVTLLLAALAFTPPTATAQSPDRYLGLSLSDALRRLQAKGLRIVYTSATVTAGLRVSAEPRARTPRQQLDELLSPHDLEARDGPGGVIQIVRAEATSGSPARVASEGTGTIEGRVVHTLTGTPLDGVAVLVDGTAVNVRTDADGRFTLRPLHAGAWNVRASLPGFGVLARTVRVLPGAAVNVTFQLSPTLTTHSERVTVSGSRPYWQDRGSTPGTSLDRSDFEQSTGGVVDDPIRSVHALPRVTAADDLRAEFIVRGSPFRHVEVAVDGVETPWLQHTAYGRGTAGSVSMLTSHVVGDATLRVGAYPRRSSDRLGAELDVTIREGSREQFELRGAVGGSSATIVGEGPLGGSGERARGSWLAAVRQSFLEWPPVKGAAARTAFGFSDGLAKLVYDVRPNHRVGLSVFGGTASVDGEDILDASEPSDGMSLTTVSSLSLRSSLGSSLVLTQRVSVVTHRFQSTQPPGQVGERGTREELVYRADVARPMFGGLLEAGARFGRATLNETSNAAGNGPPADSPALSASQRSGYAHFGWSLTPGLMLSPGVRVTDSTLVPRPSVARWILAEYSLGSRWTLNASTGVSHQPPDLSHVRGRAPGLPRLRSERATYLDLGIEQRLGAAARWQATVFRRNEADILREPDLYPRLDGGTLVDPPDHGRYVNSLSGSSQGIELLVQHRTPTGLSGWLAYAYGRTRQVDADRQELFWADFDRRHALNVVGVYRVSTRTSVGATFRAGSGFPIPAYVASRDGGLFVSDKRNQVRLPAYARLDVRARRVTEAFGRRLTLYGEVANVLNRANVGLAPGSITATGEGVGFTSAMQPRRASAGVLIEF